MCRWEGGDNGGGEYTRGGEPKCIMGGGEVTWLGVVLPLAKNMSDVGVSRVDDAMEKEDEAGL